LSYAPLLDGGRSIFDVVVFTTADFLLDLGCRPLSLMRGHRQDDAGILR
jgi:hypothetical protein